MFENIQIKRYVNVHFLREVLRPVEHYYSVVNRGIQVKQLI